MTKADDQALLLGALIGLSLATAGGIAAVVWWWAR